MNLADIVGRNSLYRSRLTAAAGGMHPAGRAAIDSVAIVDAAGYTLPLSAESQVPLGCSLSLRGWAIDPESVQRARAVLAVVDDSLISESVYGFARRDIKRVFESEDVLNAGFACVLPTCGLELGTHWISIRVVSHDLTHYRDVKKKVEFSVVDSMRQLPPNRMAGKADIIAVDSVTSDDESRSLTVKGWAFDVSACAMFASIYAIVDEAIAVRTAYGFTRADVARHLDTFDAGSSGFSVHVSTAALQCGGHQLRIAAVASDGTGYYVSPPREFNV